ncbi:MAG: DegV family protein [Dehalococcoidales bacterium]|nr:DegV family protein [Dehalococcoidales bacterium]
MTVKIVTDSAADLPPGIKEELGIEVVPLYVRFGNETFKTGVDISNDDFYRRLVKGDDFPNTIQPSPADFQQMYEKLAKDADGIVSVHLSEKFSGTANAARQAGQWMSDKCPVEVIDSASMTIGLGMVCMAAARAAKDNADIKTVVNAANEAIPEIRMLALFDTLKYLAKGGRIGQAKNLLGALLNIKPMLSMKDGIVVPVSQVRSYTKGLEQLYQFLSNALQEPGEVKDVAIMYNTTPKEASALAERIAPLYPTEKVIMGQMGPILGTHAGPNMVLVVVRKSVENK